MKTEKIAVVGTGISGLTAAWKLHRAGHDIQVFEAADYIGGHTHTHDIEWQGKHYAVDTGFIVFNTLNYPNFCQLLNELQVPSRETVMSFGVHCRRTGLEYSGTSLNTLFAQRRNVINLSFYRLLKDILRFNRTAKSLLNYGDDGLTLGDYLDDQHYSAMFRDYYILPMGAAIWSTDVDTMLEFPARPFIGFLDNHKLLSVSGQPLWRVIEGGSKQYVEKLISGFRERIHLNTPVQSLRRHDQGVDLALPGGESCRFDQVFVATHSDTALAMLADPSDGERNILGAMSYQDNRVLLHTDTSVLPRSPRALAAWNYCLPKQQQDGVMVTYDMNILQGIQAPCRFLVSLNDDGQIADRHVLRRIHYRHPQYNIQSMAAQKRVAEINGRCRTYYCGAYWGYGFHEDGVVSAMNAVETLQRKYHDEQLYLSRTG